MTKWERKVDKYVILVGDEYPSRMIQDTNAVTLLERQHAGFVRLVTQQHANCNNPCTCCCDALLAALAKQGKK